jgi:hypothetical protein
MSDTHGNEGKSKGCLSGAESRRPRLLVVVGGLRMDRTGVPTPVRRLVDRRQLVDLGKSLFQCGYLVDLDRVPLTKP